MIEVEDKSEIERTFASLNVVIIGLPGSGKTTLINSLSPRPNYISVGDITRNEVLNNGPLAGQIKQRFMDDKPWDADFVISLIAPYLLGLKKVREGFVLDGIPRRVGEVLPLLDWFRKNSISIDLLLNLQVAPDLALERRKAQDRKDRLELPEHYDSRIRSYLSGENEMLEILRNGSLHYLSIDTNLLSEQLFKDKLIEFVATNF